MAFIISMYIEILNFLCTYSIQPVGLIIDKIHPQLKYETDNKSNNPHYQIPDRGEANMKRYHKKKKEEKIKTIIIIISLLFT